MIYNYNNFWIEATAVIRTAIVMAISIFGSMTMVAQEWDHEYVPFVEEGKIWNCSSVSSETDYSELIDCIFTISGDTLIDKCSYKKVVCQNEGYYADRLFHYYCAVREEDFRVFIVEAGAMKEKVLYDFSSPDATVFLSYSNHKFAREPSYRPTFLPDRSVVVWTI